MNRTCDWCFLQELWGFSGWFELLGEDLCSGLVLLRPFYVSERTQSPLNKHEGFCLLKDVSQEDLSLLSLQN